MHQRFRNVAVACAILLLSFSNTASALRCYACVSGESWSDCQANALVQNCDNVSRMSLMGHDIFLAPQSRQLEQACVSVHAKGTISGVTGYAYVRQCFYNDKALCSLLQSELPPGLNIVTCDICTGDLCNGANSIKVAFSSVAMVLVAFLLWK
ncbi:uncharacterized protein LOC128732233 [Anopheles nili]|uniref:uncharacterized protein LOC128732233 n=1 Tax=Anopheles nili TaxID=185578 RepID=UPI00237AE6BF|nr:uncharacterized protein LOC128732233 [Anopheles nili]